MVDEGTEQSTGLLLDTNIVIAVLAQEDTVIAKLRKEAGSAFVSVITLGELRFGARKSGRVEENLRRVENLAAESGILTCNEETSRRYGEVKDGLRSKGRPIPENDLWIAATAMQHGLALVTRDSHFDHVEGLRVERW